MEGLPICCAAICYGCDPVSAPTPVLPPLLPGGHENEDCYHFCRLQQGVSLNTTCTYMVVYCIKQYIIVNRGDV